ncbi:MAG: desulfoferrodoxin [Clostridiales bacterium]|nr:desulfoferrodoxin [Clostridiales bacterium]
MLKVYQCDKCKKTIISKEELKLEGWTELVAGSTDAAQEKHVPVVTKKCKTVAVNVGSVAHPMTEEHLIEWVALETEQGYQVKHLSAGSAPICTFTLADGDKAVAVYAYCNLHSLWATSI